MLQPGHTKRTRAPKALKPAPLSRAAKAWIKATPEPEPSAPAPAPHAAISAAEINDWLRSLPMPDPEAFKGSRS